MKGFRPRPISDHMLVGALFVLASNFTPATRAGAQGYCGNICAGQQQPCLVGCYPNSSAPLTTCHEYYGGTCDPQCRLTCSSTTPCATYCRDFAGGDSSCGTFGVCGTPTPIACSLFCTDSTACAMPCTASDGSASTCGDFGVCNVGGGPVCGNGVPDPGETCSNCIQDVAAKPTISFDPESPRAGQPVTISTDPSLINIPPTPSWAFGDGHSSSGQVVQHGYTAPGSYVVRLTAQENRCNSTIVSEKAIPISQGVPPNGRRYTFTDIFSDYTTTWWALGVTEIEFNTYSHVVQTATTLRSPRGRSAGGQSPWEYSTAVAYAAMSWDLADLCDLYHAYSEHFEAEPTAVTGSTLRCTDPAGCDAGACTDNVCLGRAGLWICTDGQGASEPHDCGSPASVCGNGRCESGETTQSCPVDCPSNYSQWLIDTSQDATYFSGGECGSGAPAYNDAIFKAGHNSYSGGDRGSILQQLQNGLRFVEYDIHDKDTFHPAFSGEYRLGHLIIGMDVDHTPPNPPTNDLTPWLEQVADWSNNSPGHKPLVVTFDLKSSLIDDNPSFAAGNLGNLNEKIASVFGPRLFTPSDVPDAWPTVDDMRNRVLVVLSGGDAVLDDDSTRRAYLRDLGYSPAVAINANGQVLEVHHQWLGGINYRIYYWTGEYRQDGSILWHRHGWLMDSTGDTDGYDCAVALNDTGHFGLMCNDQGIFRLVVGHMGEDYEIAYSQPMATAFPGSAASAMSLRFVAPQAPADPPGLTIRQIYQAHDGNHWEVVGRLDLGPGPVPLGVTWDAARHQQTADPLYDRATDEAAGRTVHVFNHAEYPPETLHYQTAAAEGRIRWQQLAFAECQQSNADPDLRAGWFRAAGAATAASDQAKYNFLQDARRGGKVVRAWDFAVDHAESGDFGPPAHFFPNFPATNEPYQPWYLDYTTGICLAIWDPVSCDGP